MLAALPASPAHAMVITVTTPNEAGADGLCSLREAIQAANTNAPVEACGGGSVGPDYIKMSTSGIYFLSLVGAGEDLNATGDLDITEELEIEATSGANVIIDGNLTDRVFHIHPGVKATISKLTIQRGSNVDGGVGGGILNAGTLILNSSTVKDNSNFNVGGGGIYNGYAYVNPTMILTDSTISGNTATTGGGIDNYLGATATLNRTTVSGNSTPNPGGSGTGGGIRNDGAMTLTNSTVSGNTATVGGGGIGQFDGGLTLNNSTVSENLAPIGGGITSGTCSVNCGIVVIKNTIIANNSVGNCGGAGAPSNSYLGVNLFDDNTCDLTVVVGAGLAGLDGLALNAPGTTKTHALMTGSPAINAVPWPSDCTDTASSPIATDQRGVTRPQGSACDIGAYELALSVGGTVELLGQPDAPGSAQASASSSVPYAALAGGLAAGVLALASGGWYARRRWLP
ncbi:MAG: CSLREA domain-containing protein [Dehalococcoidia bacterium]|nr:CSLREA domain-containing protein [Dehalococcoidia bacterium]